jgi:hypothetical protein
MKKIVLATVAAVVLSLMPMSASPSEAASNMAYTQSQRAAIRKMPITARPYRPGHVYGNTVRMLNRVGL